MAKRRVPQSRPVNEKGAFKGKVQFVREEVSNLLTQYFMIRDCVEGEPAIKGLIGPTTIGTAGMGSGSFPMTTNNIVITRALRYLPMPNPEDQSEQNRERYKSYVMRAVFYNVTGRTLEGMAGQIFLRPPEVEIPDELKPMQKDSNGSGLTLDQSAYRAVRHAVAYGRTGLLVDFPIQDTPISKADIQAGKMTPTFTIYNPWDIINWRIALQNGKRILTMLVLREVIEEEGDDGFELTTLEQYRVLRIDPSTGMHLSSIYQRSGQGFSASQEVQPKDANGKPLDFIPFIFIGSENNDISPNKPPMYDLASLNIAHYRNSADYEEACFQAGQPTPVLSGLSQDWVENVLKGEVMLGSRAAIPLPVGAKADLLQARENSMPIEAMKHKESEMVSLGAKLVQLQRSSRTATEQIIETTSESSTLANCAINVSNAFEWGLGVALGFVSTAKKAIKYRLNKDFDLTSMTADDQNAIIKQWQSGAIGFPEMRAALRRAGTATMDDQQMRAAILKDIEEGFIPDPAGQHLASPNANDPAAASGNGGPQPGSRRRQPSPQGGA